MTATPSLRVLEDPRFEEHRAARPHPERPERLHAVGRAIAELRDDRMSAQPPREASADELLRVHTPELLTSLEAAAARAPTQLDPDTYACQASFEIARLAAGGTIDLALQIASGDQRHGFAALRPPGHHAESDHAMGFCLLNNVAIAARALQADAGLDKLLVFDFDVHHGNGTQHSFDADPSILYVSTHQYPFYPGTGGMSEVGIGRGEGATVNVPLPPGCGDHEYLGVMQAIVEPVTRQHHPEMILVSCGFDAHAADPLGSMDVSRSGFLGMARGIRALADELCGGRLLFVLEGGYAPSGLYEGTSAVLEALMESPPGAAPGIDAPPGSTLRSVIGGVEAVHRRRYPAIGL